MECSTGDWACELSRIADALSGFDWNSFAATLLATLVGAGVAAGVSFWLAERDRPRPMWKAHAVLPRARHIKGIFTLEIRVTNIGDGAAYHPRMRVDGPNVTGKRHAEEAVVELGESFRTYIGAPGSGEISVNQITGDAIDSRAVDWSGDVIAHLEWHQPPRRKHTKRAHVRVAPPEIDEP